jgi:hypothetical protein
MSLLLFRLISVPFINNQLISIDVCNLRHPNNMANIQGLKAQNMAQNKYAAYPVSL